MTITLLIIAVASIALNVFQYMERRIEQRDTRTFIEENVLINEQLADIKEKYQNEIHHKEWAIGRIKDQQAVIDQLKKGVMPKKSRKEADHVR